MAEPDFVSTTRASYDAIAGEYVDFARGELVAKPLERAALAAFADLVRAAGGGVVADVGCGTGRITEHLAGLGLDIFGVDLSPGMLAVARQEHPELRFREGSMLRLGADGGAGIRDGELAGLVAWYSTIHVPDAELPTAFAEFARVLRPGGHAVLAFQVGDEPLRLSEALGHEVELDFHRRQPEAVAGLLAEAGLPVRARVLKERDTEGPFPERTSQAFLIARKEG
ncbi:class I SAM-dependent methyltransferase [Streptomyces sp. A7024]|uniref:Class I SAM-dependent methyltransferase n=1 Tax=Streptomyces coryli TaxID=1128680 RepID=A0A6G4U9U6_9ACTN|nr:class I SAM-dependent methyltransferase [Streptomyces coryli]